MLFVGICLSNLQNRLSSMLQSLLMLYQVCR